jgi:hypothetical protein
MLCDTLQHTCHVGLKNNAFVIEKVEAQRGLVFAQVHIASW